MITQLMSQQTVLPSQVPYSFLDYGVTVIVLIVLGVALWFVFKVLRSIMNDQNTLMTRLIENIELMKEALLTHIVDTRYLAEMLVDDQKMKVWERTSQLEKEIQATSRRHEEKLHREEQTRHVEQGPNDS